MKMALEVPAYGQEYGWTCLPACIRMVLAYHGKTHQEVDIAEACGTVPVRGTRPESAIEGVQKLGYRALWFENADLKRLESLIDHKWPVIVFLRAKDLPHGRRGLHCVVVVGIESKRVLMLDPALGTQIAMPAQKFADAWQALDNQGMVIWMEG